MRHTATRLASSSFNPFHAAARRGVKWQYIAAGTATIGGAAFAWASVTGQPRLSVVHALNKKTPAAAAAAEGEELSVTAKMIPHEMHKDLPVEAAKLTFAPEVPPPITRRHPVLLRVDLIFDNLVQPLTRRMKFEYWSINGHCPGPFIRAREGDVLEVNTKNVENSMMAHNIDFHAVDGPGGGAPLLQTEFGRSRTAHFHLTHPGLYIYHCAAAPVPQHIAQGMYGLILVEPKEGLPVVDKEYYVMQSEFYVEEPGQGETLAGMAYHKGLEEDAQVVVFNGREGALTDSPLKANVGDTVRLFVGNAGPNLSSAFHVIGAIFEKVYREGDLISPPSRNIQTTHIPPGGASTVEMTMRVPGTHTLIDHAIYRLDKGCVGFLQVFGDDQPHIYHSATGPTPCYNCKLHN